MSRLLAVLLVLAAPASVAEEPVAEEPVAEEAVAEEAVAEPVAEEPVAEEPVAEEPVAEAAPTHQGKRAFVLPLAAPEGLESEARLVQDLVAAGLAARGLTVVSQADVDAALALESDRQALSCEDDSSCVAALADQTRAQFVVTARMGRVGREIVVSLALLDTKTAAVTARASGSISAESGGGSDPRAATVGVEQSVRGLMDQLFGEGETATSFTLPKGEALSFAVLDLEAAGVDATITRNLTQILSAEVKRVDGATVVGRADIEAMLQYESDREMLGCSGDTSCLAELGDALGVSRIVVGQVGKVADSYVVSLRLIRTEDVAVESRVTETFRGQEEQLLNAIRFATWRLLGIEAQVAGGLLVSTSEEGATLFLDGRELGVLPLPPVMELVPGRHELRVTKEGFYDFHGDIYVAPGQTVTQWVELHERPAAFYETWPFWSAVGLGGAAVFAVAVGATSALVGYGAYEYLRPRPIGPVKATLPARGGE